MDDFEFLIDADLDAYLQEHTTKEDSLLAALDRETHLKILAPRMLSGNYQGKFLEFISQMIKPQKILEIGAFTGYSSICLAKGLEKGGKLYTIEHDILVENLLHKYIKESGNQDKIEVLWGEAKDVLEQLEDNSFDLVFLDADKENYSTYYPIIKNKMKIGSWLLVDNILWNGKVWKSEFQDKATKQIREFNDTLAQDSQMECVSIILRDGMYISRKIK